MDAFQKVTREILDRIRGLRVDDEGWKTAKQTVRFSLLRIVVRNAYMTHSTLTTGHGCI